MSGVEHSRFVGRLPYAGEMYGPPEAFKIRRNNFICDSGVERALSRMTNTRRGG